MMRYMERRGYSESTIRTYTMWVSQFALHYGKSPGLLSEEDIGAYLDYLRRGVSLRRRASCAAPRGPLTLPAASSGLFILLPVSSSAGRVRAVG